MRVGIKNYELRSAKGPTKYSLRCSNSEGVIKQKSQLSNGPKPCYFLYIADYTTHLYRDDNKPL